MGICETGLTDPKFSGIIGAFGGFVLPLILGLFVRISGKTGYSHGLMVLAGLSVIFLPLLVMIKRYQTKSIGYIPIIDLPIPWLKKIYSIRIVF